MAWAAITTSVYKVFSGPSTYEVVYCSSTLFAF